jgi:hypothetical protein
VPIEQNHQLDLILLARAEAGRQVAQHRKLETAGQGKVLLQQPVALKRVGHVREQGILVLETQRRDPTGATDHGGLLVTFDQNADARAV